MRRLECFEQRVTGEPVVKGGKLRRGPKQDRRRLRSLSAGELDRALKAAGIGEQAGIAYMRHRLLESRLRFVGHPRDEIGLGCGDQSSGADGAIRRQFRCLPQEGSGRCVPTPGPRTVRRALELGGHALVGPDGSRRTVPSASIRVTLTIAGGSQR